MTVQHYLQFADFDADLYAYLFKRTAFLKRQFKSYIPHHPLQDRTLVMVFEKNSTRTRLSFEAGMYQLGGHAIFMNTRDSQLGRGEPIEDAAKVISRMSDLIMVRTFGQEVIETFAANSYVPVINGLTNEHHPCQVFADIFTYVEARGPIQGKTVTWIGDANNMMYSWIQAAEVLDFHLHIATPATYALDRTRLSPKASQFVSTTHDPKEACRGAHLVTTDVWTSMGYESENAARLTAFETFIVDDEKMASAHPDAVFMHCLPAHRGEEVSASVIDGAQSLVWAEAENRLHVQKALMEYLLIGRIVNLGD